MLRAPGRCPVNAALPSVTAVRLQFWVFNLTNYVVCYLFCIYYVRWASDSPPFFTRQMIQQPAINQRSQQALVGHFRVQARCSHPIQ